MVKGERARKYIAPRKAWAACSPLKSTLFQLQYFYWNFFWALKGKTKICRDEEVLRERIDKFTLSFNKCVLIDFSSRDGLTEERVEIARNGTNDNCDEKRTAESRRRGIIYALEVSHHLFLRLPANIKAENSRDETH